jgi:hypothetical protein
MLTAAAIVRCENMQVKDITDAVVKNFSVPIDA